MKFFGIGDEHTILGLRLVGIEGLVATTRDEALAALNEAVAKKDLGVVLITEAIAAEIRDELEARLYGFGFPLVLEIPGPSGPASDRPDIEEIIRRAIGVSI
jgi:V/A-type H+/Na+-transporting ATPase subunit F